MHYSRMRTGVSAKGDVYPRGVSAQGVSAWGVCPGVCVSAWGCLPGGVPRGCLPREDVCIPVSTGADPSSPPVDRILDTRL